MLKKSITEDNVGLFRSCFSRIADDDKEFLDSMHTCYVNMYRFEDFLIRHFGDDVFETISKTEFDGATFRYPAKNIRSFIVDDKVGPKFRLPTVLLYQEEFHSYYDNSTSTYYISWRSKSNSKVYREAMKAMGPESVYLKHTLDDLKGREDITIKDVVAAMKENSRKVLTSLYSEEQE